MADYIVQSSDGTFTVTVQTGTINNQYDIPFIGQDAINYGDDLVAAQLHQLENFSNTSAPTFGTARVKGQLWYDSTPSTGRLNVFDGTSWDKIPLDIDVVHTTGAETIFDVKTFDGRPVFASAGAPMTINSNTVVPNLNADLLDDLEASAFADASQGIKADNAQPALPLNTAGAGFVLSADLTNPNNYTWISPSVSAGQVQVASTLSTTTNILMADNTDPNFGTGVQDPLYNSGLTYDANSKTLATLFFTGSLSGNATSATSATTATTATGATNIDINATTSTDTTTYPVLVGAVATGNQVPFVDNVDLSYNANSGTLSSVAFAGDGSLITALNLTSGTHTGTLATTRGGTGVTSPSTGTGGVVLSTTPTFVTNITTPLVTNATSVGIQYNTTTELITQDNTVLGQTTGAQVRHHNTNLYDIGMNVLPQFNWDTSDTLEAQHCGMLTGHSDGNPHTLTIPVNTDVDFPVGGVATIINASAIDYTLVDDATATLFYLESGIGLTDTTGGCIIGAGGVATLYRFSATEYHIWGSEITFTP